MDHDRNLLFGVLALQADLISPGQFVEACSLWAGTKHTPLADLLTRRGWLSTADRRDVERLLDRKLARHNGDARASLADLLGDGLRRSVAAAEDAGLFAPLAAHEAPAYTPQLGPPGPVLVSTVADEPTHRQRYVLTRLHATGGIGQVWVARDPELGREVALKELRPDRAGNQAAAGRFLEEAQITGQLEHPGIVPVYELARRPAEGRPFYTMRLVKGRTLDEATHDYHRRRAAGRAGPLELRELLGAFVAVCNAVAYAHSRGVLHRDLKPQNVVLGDFGEVVVLDWGLAKLVGARDGDTPPLAVEREAARGETVQGQVLGTPAYMAPEQAQGRLDLVGPATDVYGLGAVLYEVLTGGPPFAGPDAADVLERVVREAPEPPRRRVAQTPRALEAVCLKALAKQPGRRYATAGELAQEVRRWLADEAVAAYREPLPARLARWGRRHPAGVAAAAAAVLVCLLLGGGGAFWVQRGRAERERRAGAELAQAIRLRAESLGAGPERRRSLLAEALAAADRADALLSQGGADDELWRRVQGLVQELREAERDRRMLARLQEVRLSATAVRDGHFDQAAADAEYRRAFREYGVDPDEPDVTRQLRGRAIAVELAAALDDWAAAARDGERARLHALARQVDPDEGRDRLRAALAAGDVRALKAMGLSGGLFALPAATAVALAEALRQKGEAGQAEAVLRQAWQRHPEDFWVNERLGWLLLVARRPDEAIRFRTAAVVLKNDSPGARLNLGLALQRKGRLDEALAEYRRAIELKGDYAEAHGNLGLVLAHQGRLDQAIREYRTAIDLRGDYAEAHCDLGLALYNKGQPDDAIAQYRKAIQLNDELPEAHYNLGVALQSKGQLDDAALEYRKTIALKEGYAEAHNNLGSVQQNKGQLDDAIAEYRKAIRSNTALHQAHLNLANALRDKGQLDEAIAEYRKAVELRPAGPDAHDGLADALKDTGRLDEAIAEYRKVIELRKDSSQAYSNFGNLLRRQGRLDEAVAAHRKALAIKPDSAPAHNNLGNALADKGLLDEAGAEYRKAIGLRDHYAEAHCNLAFVLQRQGRFAEALASMRRGHELGSPRPGWRNPSGQWVHEAKRLVELDEMLRTLLRSGARPGGARQQLELADFCSRVRRHVLAARLATDAFAADPRLADDLQARRRYHAACGAALAADGQGEDAAGLNDGDRARLRKQALDWLRADLALAARLAARDRPAHRGLVRQTLHGWQQDGDLAGVRGHALARLAVAECADWVRLWADVDRLLQAAGGPPEGP
jgi:tetratricopeptide (TPR) repeat protein/tRNA A-37 threonylcarbamoyl transferase component Bud32